MMVEAAHYERLLFRTRAEKARLEARLAAFEDLVRALADGSLPFIHADHAAKALLDTLAEEEPRLYQPQPLLSEALAEELAKDKSRRAPQGEDNPKPCTDNSNIDWECAGCGLFLGSRPSPDFGNYPCVCGKKNRPRRVHPNSHNHASRRRSR